MKPLVVHVAQIDLAEESGMGRVAWHWKRGFERRGYKYVHIGSEHVGALPHPSLFPYAAYRTYKKLGSPVDLLLVHEPASGIFARRVRPTIVFSHGLERRCWQLALQGKDGSTAKLRRRTKMLFPFWRLRQCDAGLNSAAGLLLSNHQDSAFAEEYYKRDAQQIFVFKNGTYPSTLNEMHQPEVPTILFLGSWLERKGINTLIDAARILEERAVRANWLLAGTGVDSEKILPCWPQSVRPFVHVVSKFDKDSEESFLARASLFVLPSYFEGQPLALLQAMEAGRCCITTDCCGQRDLIRHGFNGLLHTPGDARRLAFLIEECLADKELKTMLGRNAKFSVQGRSWETVSSEVVNFSERAM
jgi:glycosyltransferase involved in cell wall biosynthesis